MCARRAENHLPQFLSPLFWEIKPEEILLVEYVAYVVERIIEYGDDRAISWLLGAFAREEIVAVVKSSRRISPNTATLWSLVLDIPKEEVKCLSKPSILRHTSS